MRCCSQNSQLYGAQILVQSADLILTIIEEVESLLSALRARLFTEATVLEIIGKALFKPRSLDPD
jgi:hypothetical protein